MKTKPILVLFSAFPAFATLRRGRQIFLWLAVALCVGGSFSAFGQGSLTPPGAPAATMKSLDQIEARTLISSAPFTISASGSYYLTKNLSVSSGNAVTISASEVTLDLNGFTISSTAAVTTATGILLSGGNANITILNGHIKGGVTFSGGTYSGTGFGNGIATTGSNPTNVRVVGVSVSGCRFDGINLPNGYPNQVESCVVNTVGGYGIVGSNVLASIAWVCGNSAITATNAVNCYGYSTNVGDGVNAKTALGCYGQNDGGTGSNSGLSATTATYCTGYSFGAALGVRATIAQNCYGESNSGYGLEAIDMAIGCSGVSATFGGLYSHGIAIGCVGKSTSGSGVFGQILNSCMGSSTSGSPVGYLYHYNMPPP